MRRPSLVRELTSRPLEKPCAVPWDEMIGSPKVRCCATCARDVYDLGAMTPVEAELRLLNAGVAAPCIRFTLDDEGEVIHAMERALIRPASRARALAAVSALGVALTPAMAGAKRPTKFEPTPCVVLYGDQPLVATAAGSGSPPSAPPAAAPPACTAAAPSAAPPPRPPPTGGAPPQTQRPIAFGLLDLHSRVPRKVMLASIELNAPTTYRLTPGDFALDVTDPNGKHRSVKIKISANQTTTLDLDRR